MKDLNVYNFYFNESKTVNLPQGYLKQSHLKGLEAILVVDFMYQYMWL